MNRTTGLVRAAVAVVATVAALAVATPASASTRLNDVQYGNACGSRTFYTTLAADATMDGSIKVDLANLAFGARVNLPAGCGNVTTMCSDVIVSQTAAGAVATTTPFGNIAGYFTSRSAPVFGTSSASQSMTSCWTVNSRSATVSTKVPLENAYIWTGRYKLKSYTLQSRVRVVYGGTTYSTPWAKSSVTL